MTNYLALIRKADFIDLYKYGSYRINKEMVSPFFCDVKQLSKEKHIFENCTKCANMFDSSFSYLFIHFTKENDDDTNIKITDVQNIYPLDEDAKKELSISFDTRIKINDPIWPDCIREWQKKQTIQKCKNGAANIWKIYNISEPIDNVREIITDDILNEVIDELYANCRPSGNQPIWVYIMRYERHAFYPKNTVGAFMDTVNAIFNYYNKNEVDSESIESTGIMQFLYSINGDEKFESILQKLYSESRNINFINLSKEISPNYDIIKIATLFYLFRNRYKENFYYENKWEKFGKDNGKEFPIVCYMLGCVLGYEHTYDCLYDFLPLAIFKEKQSSILPKKDHTEDVFVDSIKSERNNTIIEEDNSLKEKIQLPCKMGKPKKGGGFMRKPCPLIVESIEKYNELKKNGYEIITENKELW